MTLIAPRVTIPHEVGSVLQQRRHALKLSQREVCAAVGIHQPVTFYSWEKGQSRPTLDHFLRYLDLLQLEKASILARVEVGESRLDRVWRTQYRRSPANRVRSYVNLSELRIEDLAQMGDQLYLTPRHYADQAVPRP
jgi:transcriptional regulator with XRE-family HTH domain